MYINKIKINFNISIGILIVAVLLGYVTIITPIIGLVCIFAPLLACIVFSRPKIILFILLFYLPFQSVPMLSQNIADIPGVKFFNIIALGAFIVVILKQGNLLKFQDSIEKKTFIFFFVYFFFFSVSFFRSIDNLTLIHSLRPELFHNSKASYILSFYVKPCLYLIPPLFILKTLKNIQDINAVINVLMFSIFFLSCSVVIIGVLHFGDLMQGRGAIRELCSKHLGMHYNSVGTIYIICAPLLIFKALGKKWFWIMNLIIGISAILILQSRSTLLVVIASGGMLLYVLEKRKILISAIVLFGFIGAVMLPEILVQGFATGLEEKNADALLTGRISRLWIPLISEWGSNYWRLLFGVGQYGLMLSPLWASGFLVQAVHAHNAYINFFLNNGIVLLVLLIFVISKSMLRAWYWCKKIDSPLCFTLFFSILSYLVGGISERYIYPHTDNMILLPLIAILVNLIRLHIFQTSDNL